MKFEPDKDKHRKAEDHFFIIVTYRKVVDFTRLAGLLRGTTNQKATGSNPVGFTTWLLTRFAPLAVIFLFLDFGNKPA